MKEFPYNELQRKWIDDLKTTDAPQTTGYLYIINTFLDKPAGYCCLGRACVVAGFNYVTDCTPVAYFVCPETNRQAGGGLLESLTEKLKLRDALGKLKIPLIVRGEGYTDLAEINDRLRWSFKQIAEYIEANPENVFTNLEDSE